MSDKTPPSDQHLWLALGMGPIRFEAGGPAPYALAALILVTLLVMWLISTRW
jgi:hypothetical protein